VGEGQGGLSDSPARQALDRGDFVEAGAQAKEEPDVQAYLRPDRAAIVLAILSFLLFVPIVVYYVLVR
jgi:hypothetical protein